MKKLLVLVIMLALALSAVVGCSDKKDGTNDESSLDSSTEQSSDVSDKQEDDSSAGEVSVPESEADNNSSGETLPDVSKLAGLDKYVSLGKYMGVEIANKLVVDDAALEATRKSLLEEYLTYEDIGTSRPAQLEDQTVIDFKGVIAATGKAFEGGTSEDVDLVLGSGDFIDGFEDGVVGHRVGDVFDLMLTFPEDYFSEEMAGVTVIFTVTLKKISKPVYPEMTDKLAEEMGYGTAADFETAVQTATEKSVHNKNVSAVWGTVLGNAEIISYPEGYVDAYAKQYYNYYYDMYEYYATMYGVELEEYLEMGFGTSLEDFAADLEKTSVEYGEALLKEVLVMYAIADNEFGRDITDEEYEAALKVYADEKGITVEEVEKEYDRATLMENTLWDKTMEYLHDNAVFGPLAE